MSDKRIFVGRRNELEQFQRELGQPGVLDRLLGKPGRNVKPRVFLPHGIGGKGRLAHTHCGLEPHGVSPDRAGAAAGRHAL